MLGGQSQGGKKQDDERILTLTFHEIKKYSSTKGVFTTVYIY